MAIRAIFACDENWGIGKAGTLPWPHNAPDQRWFKECTLNSVVVMGKTTWSDPDMPKPLPKRQNVVVTSGSAPGAHVVADMKSFLKILPQMKTEGKQIWVIGGAKLFESLIPYIDEVWLSRIEGVYDCDTFLPGDAIIDNYSLIEGTVTEDLYIEKWAKK